jgi:hypothetical protein
MQPDVPLLSCCGEADAHWVDSFEVDHDSYVAIIMDERPDGPLGGPHRELGEKIVVLNNKSKWDEGTPTGPWHHLHRDRWTGLLPCLPGGVWVARFVLLHKT